MNFVLLNIVSYNQLVHNKYDNNKKNVLPMNIEQIMAPITQLQINNICIKSPSILFYQSIHSISILQNYYQFYRNMIISPQEYLSIIDELALFTTKCHLIQQQNQKLKKLTVQQTETIDYLNLRLTQEIKKNQKTQQELINLITQKSQNVNAHVSEISQQQKKFFQQQINKIKSDSNAQKIKELQKKMTQNRFKNHQMIDFYQKIQNLYMVLNNTRTLPSMPELYKWASLRKADQAIVPSTNNIPLGTQKSILTSKINTSKINNPNFSKSKMNTSKLNINTSKLNNNFGNVSRVNINIDNQGQLNKFSKKNIGSLSTKKQESKSTSQKGKGKNKQNQTKLGRTKSSKKQKSLKNEPVIQILSTQSLTQQINIDNQALTLNEIQRQMSENINMNKNKTNV